MPFLKMKVTNLKCKVEKDAIVLRNIDNLQYFNNWSCLRKKNIKMFQIHHYCMCGYNNHNAEELYVAYILKLMVGEDHCVVSADWIYSNWSFSYCQKLLLVVFLQLIANKVEQRQDNFRSTGAEAPPVLRISPQANPITLSNTILFLLNLEANQQPVQFM